MTVISNQNQQKSKMKNQPEAGVTKRAAVDEKRKTVVDGKRNRSDGRDDGGDGDRSRSDDRLDCEGRRLVGNGRLEMTKTTREKDGGDGLF